MVSFTQLAATAVLAFCATASALPNNVHVRDDAELEQSYPIGMLPASKLKSLASSPVTTAQHVHVDLSNLGNATVAEPSEQVVAAAKRALAGRAVADTRVLYDNTNYPYRAMGRLIWSNGIYCSASLVGARIVAAARHCVPLDGQQVTLTFQPDFYNSDRFASSTVNTFIYVPKGQTGDCDVGYDWAFFILNDALGNNQGYLGAKIIDQNNEINKAVFATFGYPGDLAGGARPYRTTGITVSNANGCETGTPLKANAYVAGGQSGSPIFRLDDNGYYTYGTLSVQVSDGSGVVGGWWAAGQTFINTLISARNDFP
ncbi:hypothetical protein GQ53DRAFT_808061 [Thozetella sp. PMI_491]|nr:hypothetical protein GQ53DRAFT_808061 [Thozetella sp. PMI_491]